MKEQSATFLKMLDALRRVRAAYYSNPSWPDRITQEMPHVDEAISAAERVSSVSSGRKVTA